MVCLFLCNTLNKLYNFNYDVRDVSIAVTIMHTCVYTIYYEISFFSSVIKKIFYMFVCFLHFILALYRIAHNFVV